MSYRNIALKLGVAKDDDDYSLQGYAADSQWVRLSNNNILSQGGYGKRSTFQMAGICRGLFEWTANSGAIYAAIGTNRKLYVHSLGYIQNITPQESTGTLANNPFATTLASATVEVTHTAHGRQNNDTVYLRGATAVGGITPGGPSGTFDANPFTTSSGSNIVQITQLAHGMASNDEVTVAGASAFNGITVNGTYLIRVINANVYHIYHSVAANASGSGGGTPTYALGRAYVITFEDANHYFITHTSAATSTATGGGAAVTYTYEITIGAVDGVSNFGYSTGGYSVGPYSVSFSGATFTTFPRTWSFANFGEVLICNPFLGKIYEWNANWSIRAAQVTNSPTQAMYVIVTAQRQIVAIGCTNASATFDPMLLRWCDIEDRTIWTAANSNNAGSTKVKGGGFLIAGSAGEAGSLIWSNHSVYFMTYTGDFGQTYRVDEVAPNAGICGPQAFLDLGDQVYWVTPKGSFIRYTGGKPKEIPCRSKNWFCDQPVGQMYKVTAFYDQKYPAVSWLFPKNPSLECDTYIRLDIPMENGDGAAGWSVGSIDRTAWLQTYNFVSPLAVSSTGYLYDQEFGNSADGAAITRSMDFRQVTEWGDQNGQGDRLMNMNKCIVSASVASGSVGLYFDFRRYPNATVETKPSTGTPFAITNATLYIEPRGQGRSLGVRLISSGADDAWSVGAVHKADISMGPMR